MLIAYDTTTGEVLDNTGTNTAMPTGPQDDLAYVNTDARGIDRAGVGLLRLHDVDDQAAVQEVTRNYHHVDTATETVVIDGPYPALTTDRDTIPADGQTPAVVTYTDGHAPAEVTFTVNGTTTTELVQNHRAAIEVVATAPGPVLVECQGRQLTITAQEVTA
jgi:hypothetical protein